MDLKSLIKRFEKPLLVVLGAAGLTTLLLQMEFNLLEANLYDFRVSHGFQLSPDPSIVLVTLDDSTAHALDEFAPLSLDSHARFLETLEGLKPRAVGYLVDMNQVHHSNPDLFQRGWGERFVNAAQRLQRNGTPLLFGTPFDVTGEVVPPFPLSTLPHSVAVVHKDGNVFSQDKVTRRALTHLHEKPVFHLDLAERLGAISPGYLPRGNYQFMDAESRFFFFRYHGKAPYQRISFVDILKGRIPAESLVGKTLLVGTLMHDDSSDFAFTPYSQQPFTHSKLSIHANILDSIIHHQGIVRAPSWVNWVVTFFVTAFVIFWVLTSTPLYGVFASISLVFTFVVLAQAVFEWKGIWLRESQPLVAIFLSYYLIVPYRLIREYKKRWDYQRKNELLTQVEELKTNFLSLVTHDLKTPVARIQGLAEVLKSKASDRLHPRDQETLGHILASTDELNRFISSILELNKIESNALKLKLEPKDINQLIERCLEGFKAQARSKGIRILDELEPLFPVKMDPELISKVMNNLIDNALKYSPSGSEVRVKSREVGDSIEISIQDSGIGMSPEEIQNLFTRFYRAKNDTTTEIAGTGLGLYLTKYFIEAHRGRVNVESEIGRGSVFKIFLPIEGMKAKVESETLCLES